MKKKLLLQLANILKNKWSGKDETPTRFIINIAKNEVYKKLIEKYSAIDLFIVLLLIIAEKQGRDIENEYDLIKLNIFSFSIIETTEDEPDIDCDSCSGSGNRDCGKCDGSGKDECHECDGSGDEECRTCDGVGTFEGQCGTCDGTGTETCSKCDGDGVDDENNTCSLCDGDGSQECESCDGTGDYKCDDCGGSGSNDCRLCDGEGDIECSWCEGTGKELCGECDGEGYLPAEGKVEILQKYYVSYDLNIKDLLERKLRLSVVSEKLDDKIANSNTTFLVNAETGLMEKYKIDNLSIDSLYFGELEDGEPNLRFYNYYSKGARLEVFNLEDFFGD